MSALRQALPKHVRELRLHFCQTSAASKGVRDFVEKQYPQLKKANPAFPVLIRECSGVEPRVFARYEFGKERFLDVANKTEADVAKAVEDLVKAAP